jgi:ribonuclease Z
MIRSQVNAPIRKRGIIMLVSATSRIIISGVLFFTGGEFLLSQVATLGWPVATAQAQESRLPISPVAELPPPERDIYYPGAEYLAADEMRVIGCGTGSMPPTLNQASACFLVELGNGDKFIFDLGTGAFQRLVALRIPLDYLDKVFVSHLHVDHAADLGALYVTGTLGGRTRPLRVWGPSGPEPHLGTKVAVDGLLQFYNWDRASRQGKVDLRGMQMEVTEFDYRGENAVIFQENGVTVRSFPAYHSIDGAVSFVLEWNDLKFVYSGDNYPNIWMARYARGADLLVHECTGSPEELMRRQGFRPEDALVISTQVHTSPAQFGKLMSMIEPRMAIAYQWFTAEPEGHSDIFGGIRKYYDGPLSVARDFMVWNVNQENIRVRMAAVNPNATPAPRVNPPVRPQEKPEVVMSDDIKAGGLHFPELVQEIYDEINEKYGTDAKPFNF